MILPVGVLPRFFGLPFTSEVVLNRSDGNQGILLLNLSEENPITQAYLDHRIDYLPLRTQSFREEVNHEPQC